jgi:perosamine synthetase
MNDLVLKLPASLRSAMNLLSDSGEGIVFLTANGVLVASLTDGDARRAILQGVSLETSASDVANRQFKALTLLSSPVEIHQAFTPGVTHVPILNQRGEIERILRPGDKNVIALCEPNLGSLESSLVNQALDSNWISSAGSFVKEFETLFADYVNGEFALSVSNGTMGLVLALKLLDVGPGDEVLVPNFTFGATANAVIQVGAIPVFIDVLPNNFSINIDAARAKVTSKTKAIIPVHLYGNAVDMDKILEFSKKFSLKVIEDSAEAIGTKINGKHVGTFGDIGVFSFFANKTITTGEGGMIVLNNKALFKKAEMMRSHGFSPENRYWHEIWGTNMRMTNVQAAIGLAQMNRIDELVGAKQFIADSYSSFLSKFSGRLLQLPATASNVVHSHWLFTILLPNEKYTEGLQSFLQANLIETRRFFFPLHNQPAFIQYNQSNEEFPISDQLYQRGLCLPSSTTLKYEEISFIAFKISEFLEKRERFESH